MKKDELISFHYKGYLCAIRDNGIGYLCGYVFLPENHKHIKEDHESKWDVHGGITFTEPKLDDRVSTGGLGLWIGFDCAHLGDAPSGEYAAAHAFFSREGETYKDVSYVTGEIEKLVEQLGIKPNRLVTTSQDFRLDLPL